MERSEKRLLVFLTLVSLIVVIIGLGQIKKGIYSPFQYKYNGNVNSGLTNQVQQLAELKNKDIDSDGLSDYDELYQYETSPYIADSDSDGYLDKEEINSGNDPNCPAGKECIQKRVMINVNQANVNAEEISSAELRETLKKAGVPQAILDQTDDTTLMQLYQETIAETQANTNTAYSEFLVNEPFPNVNAYTSLEELKNLNVSQVREFLKSTGMDENSLNQVDDETLMAIFNQAIGQ